MTYEEAHIEASDLIAENFHTEAAIVMAEYCQYGFTEPSTFSAYIVILNDIQAAHEIQGYLTKDQQTMRDLIAKEVNNVATTKKNCGWGK